MNLDEIHRYLNFIIKKERGQWYTPGELDAVLHVGSIATFNTFYDPQLKTQRIHAALQPFRGRFNFSQIDFTDGVLQTPSGYQYATTLHIKTYDNQRHIKDIEEVHLYKEDEWVSACKSQVRKPTISKPVAMEIEQTPATPTSAATKLIEFFPAAEYGGILRYLRMPVKPVYVSTANGPRGTPTYDAINSKQLEWAEPYQNMVMLKALSSIGINLGDVSIVQFAEGKTDKALSTANKE